MNGDPIDDLVKLVSSNPNLKDEDLIKSFPQLRGNPQLVTRAKAYAVGKASNEYNDEDLNSAFGDVLKTFAPPKPVATKPYVSGVPAPLQAEQRRGLPETPNALKPHEQIAAITPEEAAQSSQAASAPVHHSDDPLGELQTQLDAHSFDLSAQRRQMFNEHFNSDATHVTNVAPGIAKNYSDVSRQISDLNNEENYNLQSRKKLNDIVNNVGADVSTPEAAQHLSDEVRKVNPNADINNMSIQEIGRVIKPTLTNQAILKRYANNKEFYDAQHNSHSVEEAALKWAKNDPTTAETLDAQTQGTDNPDMVAPAQMGKIVNNYLNQPAAAEWAQSSKENNLAYLNSKANLYQKFPEFGIQQVASKLSQEREDMLNSPNNGILNIVSPSSVDDLSKKMLNEGKFTQQEYNFYNQHRLDVLNGIKTSGFTNNIGEGIESWAKNILHTNQDKWHQALGIYNNDDAQRNAQAELNGKTAFKAKGFWHQEATESGEVLGEVIPMALTTKGLMGLGLSSPVANGISMMLATEHPTRVEALNMFPNDPVKREAYTALVTGLNGVFGALVGREKPIEGLKNIISTEAKTDLRNQVLSTIDQFTEGKITADAAKETYEKTVLGFIKKIPQYAGSALKNNLAVTGQMMGMTAAKDAADAVFGGRDVSMQDLGNDLLATAKSTFLSMAPLSVLGAHADISKESKIAANAVYEMASDPDRYRALIENLSKTDGGPTNSTELLRNLDRVTDLKKQMDDNPMLEGMKPEDKQKYLFQSLSQKVLEDKLETTTDNVLKSKIKEQIKQSESFNKRLIDGSELKLKEVSQPDKEAGIKNYYDDERNVKGLVEKIKTGQPLSDEDLQLHKNFPDEVEAGLRGEAVKQAKVDEPVVVKPEPTTNLFHPDSKYTRTKVENSLGESIPENAKATKVTVDALDPDTGKKTSEAVNGSEAIKSLKTTFRRFEKIINNCL